MEWHNGWSGKGWERPTKMLHLQSTGDVEEHTMATIKDKIEPAKKIDFQLLCCSGIFFFSQFLFSRFRFFFAFCTVIRHTIPPFDINFFLFFYLSNWNLYSYIHYRMSLCVCVCSFFFILFFLCLMWSARLHMTDRIIWNSFVLSPAKWHTIFL